MMEQPDAGSGIRDLLAELLVSRDHAIKELAAELRAASLDLLERAQEIAKMVRSREELRRELKRYEEDWRVSNCYSGKTVADRDAQRMEDLRNDLPWQELTSGIANLDADITRATLLLEHRERLFKITLSQLRTYGGER